MIQFVLKPCFLLLILFSSSIFAVCDMTVTVPKLESSKDKLINSLLQLSLNKVQANICYQQNNQIVTEARKAKLIEDGVINIQWASASSKVDEYLQHIEQPIFKGLMGFRIFVIRDNEQAKFDHINSVEQLKELVAGQGAFWGDTKVLKAAGLPVVTSTQGRRLWQMLNLKRFDYLPLGAHEPWADIELRPELNFTVEKNLLLIYPSAMYFYLSKNNQQLFELLNRGMRLAIDDGSYDELLFKSDMLQGAINKANLANRKILVIDNPYFSNKKIDLDLYKKQSIQIIQKLVKLKMEHEVIASE
ncbi:diguanylate cyclase [Paraglaciecola aquimarina]|uniref:Diguanylate cyclase n=1 Tax=Paraglaciecola algarum TaxID=3050085 RepID=A0ABS9DCH7_9ALTE|nr:diguanylate cyclase [Paraglaciecola sp. G1-23]MCF2949732.1 diguanylate cyclase [Paraglaciecola sp. G1-23]